MGWARTSASRPNVRALPSPRPIKGGNAHGTERAPTRGMPRRAGLVKSLSGVARAGFEQGTSLLMKSRRTCPRRFGCVPVFVWGTARGSGQLPFRRSIAALPHLHLQTSVKAVPGLPVGMDPTPSTAPVVRGRGAATVSSASSAGTAARPAAAVAGAGAGMEGVGVQCRGDWFHCFHWPTCVYKYAVAMAREGHALLRRWWWQGRGECAFSSS